MEKVSKSILRVFFTDFHKTNFFTILFNYISWNAKYISVDISGVNLTDKKTLKLLLQKNNCFLNELCFKNSVVIIRKLEKLFFF